MLSNKLLSARFDRANLGFKLLGGPIAGNPDIFQLDIRRSPKFGEYFRLWPGEKSNQIEALDYDAKHRQVVLYVKEPRRSFRRVLPKGPAMNAARAESLAKLSGGRLISAWRDGFEVEMYTPAHERRYLVGRDDLHLFVAELPRGNTVAEAHQALKPPEVIGAERMKRSVDRQGEWFFVRPSQPELERIDRRLDEDAHALRESRPVGPASENRAHVADQIVRIDRDAVYARGVVRHADHRPVVLDAWRRVVLNEEVRPDGAGRIRQRWID